ncbi:MAG: peptidyl-prolyl cis-trans isomerase SurA [Alphaproteobacteria bacterium]|jgi:peptidyl-prolyl cis-trans isomerase SurA|nr:peptidyl-prolyl cis-trans isomerase SurA [Alphaproteobacteria bacterium]
MQAPGRRRLNGVAMLRRILIHCGHLSAAMLLGAALVLPRTAQSQQVVVVVNGDPVTALDIEQRSKLNQLSTHKVPSRQEVLEELITEKLKIKEGKRLGFEISNNEVDSAFGNMASKMRLTVDQLTELLGKSGINPATLKHRIKADMTWPQLVRGRYSSSLQIGEKEIVTVTDNKPEESVGYDYTLRPILMIIPPGSPESFVEARRRDAESLRARFQNCEEGLAFARALKDVAVREPVSRSSADLPLELRKVLDGVEIGKLTPPETTKLGIEMFAICGKKESSAENTPGKRRAREAIVAERYEQLSKQYLSEVRRGAMLEYK